MFSNVQTHGDVHFISLSAINNVYVYAFVHHYLHWYSQGVLRAGAAIGTS